MLALIPGFSITCQPGMAMAESLAEEQLLANNLILTIF